MINKTQKHKYQKKRNMKKECLSNQKNIEKRKLKRQIQ